MRTAPYSTMDEVTAAVAAGTLVLVVDDANRENEGDLVLAAEHATAEAVAFMIREARGLLCLPMSRGRAGELGLTPMVATNDDPMRTAFTVSIDAAPRHGVGTGISANDRAVTARLAVSGVADDFTRPGHLFPLIARTGGVLVRRGHTEAAVDLTTMVGLAPIALIIEIIGDNGEMLRGDELVSFAAKWNLPITSIAAIVEHRTIVS